MARVHRRLRVPGMIPGARGCGWLRYRRSQPDYIPEGPAGAGGSSDDDQISVRAGERELPRPGGTVRITIARPRVPPIPLSGRDVLDWPGVDPSGILAFKSKSGFRPG